MKENNSNKLEFEAVLKECKGCISDIEWYLETGEDTLVCRHDIENLKRAWGELEYVKEMLK